MDDCGPVAPAATYHNTPAPALSDLTIPGASDPMTRRELACFRTRCATWRRELVERVRRRPGADPHTPIARDQRLVRLVDDTTAAIDRYAASNRTTDRRRRLGVLPPGAPRTGGRYVGDDGHLYAPEATQCHAG